MGQPTVIMQLPNGIRSFDRKDFLKAVKDTSAGVWSVGFKPCGTVAYASRFPDEYLPGLRQSFEVLNRPKNKTRHVIKWSNKMFWGLDFVN